jgi:hypothetical protein
LFELTPEKEGRADEAEAASAFSEAHPLKYRNAIFLLELNADPGII